MTVGHPDRAALAARRSGSWWLLSQLVTEAPEAHWLGELEALLAGVDQDPAAALGPETAALRAALQALHGQAGGLTALAVDRTRLLAAVFRHDDLPAPYESAALGEPMNSDRVLGLAETYHEAGFDDPAPELGPPDHLGTELRFMALLCYQESRSLSDGDAAGAAAWLARQRRFLDEHLLAWVPGHCARLAAHAATPFYAAMARLIGSACALDRDDVAALSTLAARPDRGP